MPKRVSVKCRVTSHARGALIAARLVFVSIRSPVCQQKSLKTDRSGFSGSLM